VFGEVLVQAVEDAQKGRRRKPDSRHPASRARGPG
jgi:hypothetical protein